MARHDPWPGGILAGAVSIYAIKRPIARGSSYLLLLGSIALNVVLSVSSIHLIIHLAKHASRLEIATDIAAQEFES